MTRIILSRISGFIAYPGTFDPRWALFSANSFIAAMIATYLAFRLGLQRPSWAMLTVYLTAQPLAGAVRSRAIYRLLGTLLGACAALALVPILADQPTLMSVAITGWAALCLYISLQDRTPRGYAFVLAGYTATTVAFSSVTAPHLVFDVALARVEEIVLGICCATAVHTLLFPSHVTGALITTIDAAVCDASRWTADVLLNSAPAQETSARWRLAADLTQFEILSTHLRYDATASASQTWAIGALQDKLALVLPMLTAIEDHLAALGGRRSRELDQLLTHLGEWARDPAGSRQTVNELLRRCADVEAALPAAPCNWDRLLTLSTIAKAAALIDALAATRALSAMVHGSRAASVSGVTATSDHGRRGRRLLHLDQGLAAWSVAALFAAVLGCCAIWIATAWPEGGVAAQIATIAAALYSNLDDPAPALMSTAIWIVVSLPIAAIYLFLIFPAIDGFPMLAGALAPPFLIVGYLQANPRHALKALTLILGLIGALDLQNRFSADFAAFANVNAASLFGIAAAFLAVRLFRSVSAKSAANRLIRHGWVDLAILAGVRRPMSRERWLGVMLDRLGLVVPRLAMSGADVAAEAGRSLAALQIGLDLLDLKSGSDGMAQAQGETLEDLRTRLSHVFRGFASGNSEIASTEAQALRAAIDRQLRQRCEWASAAQRQQLTALVGLRRTLFPHASAPALDGATQ
ncbi:FUSC family protein [Bradyrhizobium sp. U87765 SZCCT0131]|uniref:FUSC family protein n=1 Tax=unclassified Bradyrhizobium TaxID=2631580 RepID=UPI001BA78C04|nr:MULTISPECIES: FUSC family protein [unclassified Bradyrhizobium]MBR1217884.1 FUSC family protein [Bradyrhizobium sp. U87765 SZCCT0131]MBR1261170.1 FUSC family protein [Bradyrhizobium sp. U87765 SZCCT0134]MBR1303382.1 FUSC family protein [Bradyrhizobium sp. U87765 SZCCT0110]MBR1318988.1 FUSC family protein [Bradyrhizobium sp. U87765 SZCCT0109]MBR1347313.1 FUSC family protein [Bradyrhizobium sp. U87765 SZCCT0048]